MISILFSSVLIVVAALVAAALTYLWMSGKQRVLETQLAAQRQSHDEKIQLLDQAKGQLADRFASLSADALTQNNERFLTLARENLQQYQQKAEGDLLNRQNEINHVVKPVAETLHKMELKIADLEQQRQHSYGELKSLVGTMASDQQRLQAETASLVQALRAPTMRGQWGEMQLKTVLDMAGLREGVHYDHNKQGQEGRQRPDIVVKLPPDRVLLIDAKVPMQNYLNAMQNDVNDAERRLLHAKHTQDFKAHIDVLAKKDYTASFQSFDWVILFVPLDSLMQVAMDYEPALVEYAWGKRVVIATPTSLLGVMRTVAYAHEQFKVNENAKDIAKLGETLYKRVSTFMSHLNKMGDALNGALNKYNETVGSLERNVLPTLRQMRDKGIAANDSELHVKLIEERSRVLTAPEAAEQG
ncbi:MAG TPA: DNA recombination protein RmuC [Alphaproteobacteria bacterium]